MDRAKEAWNDASPVLYVTAAVISLVGGGAASAFIAAVLRPKAAGVNDVVTVGEAFYATWPMSVALALLVVGMMAGIPSRIGPVMSLAAAAIVLWIALGVGYAQTRTTELQPFGTAPISPAIQLPPVGSPSQSSRAIALAFEGFLKLYGTNVAAGAFAGIGVGIFAFDFSSRLNRAAGVT